MKILAVSDQVIDRLYSTSVRKTYPDIELILGCGDLPYNYLEFLLTVMNIPLLYVPGNHDPAYGTAANRRAEGGENIDLRIMFIKELMLAGLGGSVLYTPGTPNQYSQREMYARVYRLLPGLFWQRWIRRRRLDILVTHSPPAGIHDDDDPPHRGLRAINYLLRLARPRYHLHGHTFFYQQNLQDHITDFGETKIMNVYPFRVIDVD